MPQFRQGTGFIKVMHGTPPTERSDGTLLDPSEISHYEFDMEAVGTGLAISGLVVYLNTAGEFTTDPAGLVPEEIVIDNTTPGEYHLRYRTVDTTGNKSSSSPDYILEVLAPLAPPMFPTNIS